MRIKINRWLSVMLAVVLVTSNATPIAVYANDTDVVSAEFSSDVIIEGGGMNIAESEVPDEPSSYDEGGSLALSLEPDENVDQDIDTISASGSVVNEEPIQEQIAFDQTVIVQDVAINVKADAGVFPDGAILSAKAITNTKQVSVDAAVEAERAEELNVVQSYSFDITIMDQDGSEIQPANGQKVTVSFSAPEVQNNNLTPQIYHISNEMEAQKLDVEVQNEAAVAETDGFSIYTVEFTYGEKQFVLAGDGYVRLDEILDYVELTGKPTSWAVSNNELFDIVMGQEDSPRFVYSYISDGIPVILDEDDENYGKVRAEYIAVNDPEGTFPWVISYEPFTSNEWLDVTMEDGIVYRIVVTDAIMGDNTNINIPGLYQGENTTNFAPLIPVADIWVDSSKFSAERGCVNSNWDEFIPGPLMTAANSPFKEEVYATDTMSVASEYKGKHFVYYDSTVKALDGSIATTRNSNGATVYQSYNYFPGLVGTYKWEDAAVRLKDDGTEELLDLYIEYSNPMISLQATPSGTTESAFANVTSAENINSWDHAYVGLFGGNAITTGAKTTSGTGVQQRYGLQIEARPYVMDKDNNIIDAKIYFPMVDLDVNRSGSASFSGFYRANSLLSNYDETVRRYSEGAQIKDGIVINSNGDRVYIPGSDGTYKASVSYDNGNYRISGINSDTDPGTFNSGFLTLIQNGQFHVGVTQASGNGATGFSVITYVMAGNEYNYRLRHSTETLKPDGTSEADGTVGGTIQTTREGNHNGELNDGQIIDPSMIATAVGQTIVYTFTPQPGYALKSVYVWNDTDKSDPSFPTVTDMKSVSQIREGDGSDNTYVAHDDNGDGTIDRYTYSFEGINSDNAIHVVWVRTALDIRKAVSGSGSTDDTFTFTLKAWGDSNNDGTIEFVDFENNPNMGSLASRFTSLGDGLYQFTLNSFETISIPPNVIPFDFEYEAEEIQVDGKYGTLEGWTPVGSAVRSGQITVDNPFAKANFTNNRKNITEPDATLTVKKVWANDATNIRPKNIDIYIQRQQPVGIDLGSGATSISNIRTTMESLFTDTSMSGTSNQARMRNNMTAFKYGTKSQAEAAKNTRVTLNTKYGESPVYMWREGTEVFIYCDEDIHFIGTLGSLFYNCRELQDITGLSHINTECVNSLYQTFYGCIKLSDLSPLADWDTSSVTNMGNVFRASSTSASNRMTLSDLSPIATWDTSNVTNMAYSFYGTNVQDLSDIAAWNVSRVTSMQATFGYTKAAQVAQTTLAQNWKPSAVTIWTNMFQYANGGSAVNASLQANLPVFASRPGTWNNTGTSYSGAPSAISNPVNIPDKESTIFNSNTEIKTLRSHDVDESGAWVYEFEVPANTSWKVWEELPVGYAPYYSLSNTTYIDPNSESTDLGNGVGTENNPVTGAKAKSTTVLTNTRNTHELKIKKDASPSTNKKFTFTLKLWCINENNAYELPSDYPKLRDGSIKRVGPGTYEFTLIPPGTEELELPAGIRYSVVETPAQGWTLVSEHNTIGLLNTDKEAAFVNAKNDTLKVIKLWENDNNNNIVMKNRPTGANSLGIKVVTLDKTSRWKQTQPAIVTDVVGTEEQQNAYNAVRTLYNDSAVIPELKASDGTTTIQTTAPKKIYLDTAIGTLLSAGDYVVDAVAGNSGQLTVYPVENVPYEHVYTSPSNFIEDDGAGGWLYEFNIPKNDVILSVEETNIPSYYQKLETTTDVNGETIYNIVNTLDVRDLKITKNTINDVDGTFRYGIKFFFDTDTSERHPIKIGHSQFIESEDEAEYELFFENGVTYNGKNVAGLNEKINDQIVGTLTEAEGDAIVDVLRNLAENANTMVNGVDSEFTRHHITTLTLEDLGIKWNGHDSYTIYVEQGASVVGDMFTSGRRLDWFIIPTPGHDEVISVRTPYTLRRESTISNGVTLPKQIPDGVTGADGTYYFTLNNGGAIVFNDLPVGVSYDIVEMKQVGWDLIEELNESGTMDQRNDNTGTISEIWLYNGTEYTTRAAAEAAAISDVSSTGSGYINNATYTDRDTAIAASIIRNNDSTWSYNGNTYPSYDTASEAALNEVVDNNDGTYTYDGVIYQSSAEAETVALQNITSDNNNTYTVDCQQYPDYNSAKLAAESLITINASGPHDTYTVNVKYDSMYDAQNASKVAITKKPYEPREAYFTNARLCNITINKTVSGNQGSTDKYFKYDISIENAGANSVLLLDTSEATTGLTGNNKPNSSTIYTNSVISAANDKDDDPAIAGQQIHCDENGEISFSVYIQHDQSVIIKNVPYGAKYTVTEIKEDYDPTVTLSNNSDKTTDDNNEAVTPITTGPGVYSITDTYLTANTTINFANSRNGIVPTGINIHAIPGIVLILGAGFGTFMFTKKKRRPSRKEEHHAT